MTKEQMPLPALRFPEFDGDWELHELGEFIDERKDVASSDLPLYSLTIESGIIPKSKRYERSFLVKSEDGAYKRMKPKDFAYNPMNLRWGALACHHGDNDVAVSKYYDVFSVNENSIPEYLEPFLTSYKMVQFYDRMSTGTLEEKKRVHYLDFVHFKKLFPTLPEQRKIADFLTAVDGRIQQLTKKKALLEDYKKGVMQQLFTQAIRFRDDHGNDFPDWEEKKLGEVCKCFSGGTPSSGKRDYYGGSIPFIRSAEIAASKTALFLTEKGYKASAAKLVEEGDLLVALYGANSGEVGIAPIGGAINQAILCVRSKQSVRFLFFWLEYSKNSIVKTYLQGGQGNLSGKIVQSLKIELPTLSEQTKIADFLSAIDRKIEGVATQITETQAFKRGLLQQMFV